jgi:hypothetical protein
VVFITRQLSALALQNKREIYVLLFRAAPGRARGHKRSQASANRFFSVLHLEPETPASSTFIVWFQPAVWRRIIRSGFTARRFFLRSMFSVVFRGKFVSGLETYGQTRFPRNARRACES